MKYNSQIEEELFPFYALDALSEAERAEVEAYIDAFPEAKERLAILIEDAAHLGISAEPIAPSPAVKQQLMQRVQQTIHDPITAQNAQTNQSPARRPPPAPLLTPTTPPQPQRRRRPMLPLFRLATTIGAALAVVALISAFFLLQEVNRLRAQLQTLQTETVSLQAQVDDLEVENSNLERLINQHELIFATYRQPGTVTMAVGPAGDDSSAVGTLTIGPEPQSAVLIAANLQPLDQNRVYQLWLIEGETPISAGTFTVDETGLGTLTLASVPSQFDAIGVTIEPEGGSEQPTLENIVLYQQVS
jgi:anti-sigma-K factor RskA